MPSDSEYLSDSLGWPSAAIAKLSRGLANSIVEADKSGLEGTELGVVINTQSAAPTILQIGGGVDPQIAFATSKLKNERHFAAIANHLSKNSRIVGRTLVLTGSVTAMLTGEEIREMVEKNSTSISGLELDSPGELELDQACPFIGLSSELRVSGLDGAGSIIAILDGEIVPHPAIAGRFVQKANFSKSPFGSASDDAGEQFARSHATTVATIVAGDGNATTGNTAYVGVCPRATLWNYKIAPSTSQGSDVAAALEQAFLDGVKIINLSWGKSDVDLNASSLWSRTVDALFSNGVLVCKSAGNKGPGAASITVPADAANVLSIGSVDIANRNVYSGSSRGPTIGGVIKPEIVLPGGGTWAGDLDGKYRATRPPGTSFAAPFAAGMAALLWQRRPSASVSEVRSAIIRSCQQLPGVDPNSQGFGMPSIERALVEIGG